MIGSPGSPVTANDQDSAGRACAGAGMTRPAAPVVNAMVEASRIRRQERLIVVLPVWTSAGTPVVPAVSAA